MPKRQSVEEYIAEQQEAAKRIITPSTFRRFLELTIPRSVRGPSRRSLPSFKYSGAGGLTAREKRLAAGIEEPVNWEVLDELVAAVRAEEDEMLARHQAEMKRQRQEQQARAYSDRLIASIEAERAAVGTGGALPYGNDGRLPSFAGGGTFGFTPQEIEQFGGGAPATPPPAVPDVPAIPATTPVTPIVPLNTQAQATPAPVQVADVPAIPATTAATPIVPLNRQAQASPASPAPKNQNHGFTQQQIAGFGFPQPAKRAPVRPPPVSSASAAPPAQQHGFTPQQLAGFGFPQATPASASPPPPPASPAPAPANTNHGLTPQQLAGFGFPQATAAPAPTSRPPARPTQNHGFTPQELAGFGFPPEAAPRPQPTPGSEFTTAEVQQFGDNSLASMSDIDIQRAFAQSEAERLAFERDFGPIVEQEQLDMAQRQFHQDFAPLVEQEIADTRNRQRAQFEQAFGRFEAEAEQQRLAEERLARERFERDFAGGRDQVLSDAELAQQRADAEAFGPNDTNGVDRSGLSDSDWAILLNSTGYNFEGPMEGTLGGVVDRAGDTVGGAIDTLAAAAEGVFDTLVEGAEGALDNLAAAAEAAIDSLAEGAGGAFDAALDATYSSRARGTTRLERTLTAHSGGDVRTIEGGVTLVENCTGACEIILTELFPGTPAFTVGHTIFAIGPVEDDSALLNHELGHVGQYELLGDFFWPVYFGFGNSVALARCVIAGSIDFDCLHDENPLEELAD